jgi:large subunit ribosomal protein L3
MRDSGLLGKKVGMTQIFDEAGTCTPVTVLRVGPCTVVQKKTQDSEGYSAVQIGYEALKEKKVNKPYRGHFEKSTLKPFRYLKEFQIPAEETYSVGQLLDVGLFKVGDCIDVTGISKGRGFQGVVKRHGFKGGPGAHGSHFHRVPGSIGQCTTPGEVQKGQKMPGRMGGSRVTVKNLKIMAVRPEEDILLTKGAVPGPNDGLVFIRLNSEIFEERIKTEAEESQEGSSEALKET